MRENDGEREREPAAAAAFREETEKTLSFFFVSPFSFFLSSTTPKNSKTQLRDHDRAPTRHDRGGAVRAAAALSTFVLFPFSLLVSPHHHHRLFPPSSKSKKNEQNSDVELAKFEAFLKKEGSRDISALVRGSQRLAYPIRGYWDGVYVL